MDRIYTSIVISGGALSYITWNVDWLLKKQVLITFFCAVVVSGRVHYLIKRVWMETC